MIRTFTKDDVDELRTIHQKYYKHEFDFPDFLQNFICAFVVTGEDNNHIIAAGGVRTLAESVLITNKSFTPRERRRALLEVLDASCYFAGKSGHNSLHAFIQDPEWMHHLRRVGFTDCKGKAVYLEVPIIERVS